MTKAASSTSGADQTTMGRREEAGGSDTAAGPNEPVDSGLSLADLLAIEQLETACAIRPTGLPLGSIKLASRAFQHRER